MVTVHLADDAAAPTSSPSTLGVPNIFIQQLVSFGPEIGADLPSALRREWLVTNSLGGYASGTASGAA